jgi:hypothetical protein
MNRPSMIASSWIEMMLSEKTEQGPIPRTYWVIPGYLLVGPYPGGSDGNETRRNLRGLMAHGIAEFVDLTTPGERTSQGAALLPYQHLVISPERYTRFAITDREAPSSKHLGALVSYLDDNIRALRPIYLHCRGGKYRTGMVIACLMVSHGFVTPERALEMERSLRAHYQVNDAPLTDAQCSRVLSWELRGLR